LRGSGEPQNHAIVNVAVNVVGPGIVTVILEAMNYHGMPYEAASREAERLIAKGWYRNFERLGELHRIMTEQRAAAQNEAAVAQ
jgi:hypothetical protein